MSHTLKKLKQSEVARGLRKKASVTKNKPGKGLFIVLFVIILVCFLVLINYGQQFLSKQELVSPKKMIPSSDKLPAIASKKSSNEPTRGNSKSTKKKNSLIQKKDQETTIAGIEKTAAPESKINNHVEDRPLANPSLKRHLETYLVEKQQNTKPFSTDIDEQSLVKNSNKVTIQPQEKNHPKQTQAVLWQDLPIDFQTAMPVMELNGIAFLKDENERYVIINMEKYQVDDVVEEGSLVEEIRHNSIVMRFQNRRFILSLSGTSID